MERNATLNMQSKGINSLIQGFKKVGDEGKKGFKNIAKEAAVTAAAIGGVLLLAMNQVAKTAEKYREWEKQLTNTNRMLGLNNQELSLASTRMLSMVDGPLGMIPDALNQVNQGLYDYTSALGQVENMEYVWDDVAAASMFAAASGMELNAVMRQGATILAKSGGEAGDLAITLDMLAKGEQTAIGNATELTDAVAASAGAISQMNGEVQDTIAITAVASKRTGKNLNESATMIKMVAVKLQSNVPLLRSLGVESTDFIGIMEELSEVTLTIEQRKQLLGQEYLGDMQKLVDSSGELVDVYNGLSDVAGLVESQFESYAATMDATLNQAANRSEAELIKLGERMQEEATDWEIFTTKMSLGLQELAAFAIKNIPLVIGALVSLKMAMIAVNTGNPIMAIVAGLVLLISAIANIPSMEEQALADAKANREAAEAVTMRATQAKHLAEKEMEAAIAAGTNAEAIDRLTTEYDRLTVAASEAEQALMMANIAENAADNAIEIADIINDVFVGFWGNVEGLAKEGFATWLEGLDTAEKIEDAISNMNDVQKEFVMASGDGNKQLEIMREAWEAITGEVADSSLTAAELSEQYSRMVPVLEHQKQILDAQEIINLNMLDTVNAYTKLQEKIKEADTQEIEGMQEKLELRKAIVSQAAIALRIAAHTAHLEGTLSAEQEERFTTVMAQLEAEVAFINSALIASEARVAGLRSTTEGNNRTPVEGEEMGVNAPLNQEQLDRLKDLDQERIDALKEAQIRANQEIVDRMEAAKQAKQAGSDAQAAERAAEAKAEEEKQAKAKLTVARALASILKSGLQNAGEGFGKALGKAAIQFVETLAIQLATNTLVLLLLNMLTGGATGFPLDMFFVGTPFAGFFAQGGYFPARSGGYAAILGEGSQDEWIVNEDQMKALTTGKMSDTNTLATLGQIGKTESQAQSVNVGGNINVDGTFRIDGSDLVLTINKQTRIEELQRGY